MIDLVPRYYPSGVEQVEAGTISVMEFADHPTVVEYYSMQHRLMYAGSNRENDIYYNVYGMLGSLLD